MFDASYSRPQNQLHHVVTYDISHIRFAVLLCHFVIQGISKNRKVTNSYIFRLLCLR